MILLAAVAANVPTVSADATLSVPETFVGNGAAHLFLNLP